MGTLFQANRKAIVAHNHILLINLHSGTVASTDGLPH